jgi:hypothetical protein
VNVIAVRGALGCPGNSRTEYDKAQNSGHANSSHLVTFEVRDATGKVTGAANDIFPRTDRHPFGSPGRGWLLAVVNLDATRYENAQASVRFLITFHRGTWMRDAEEDQ